MIPKKCVRCGSDSSVFWWIHALGCDISGNNGTPFELCDRCNTDFVEFLRGRAIVKNVYIRRKEQ